MLPTSRRNARPAALLPFLLLMAPLPPLRAQTARDSLAGRIAARAARDPGVTVGVYLRDLGNGQEVTVNADTLFHAASTMKVPVMIEYFRSLEAGRLTPGQSVLLVNQFASIVDGSPYQLDAGDDSDSAMYARIGQRVPVRELVERMIDRSSNLATNAVIALVGAEATNATAHTLGATTMRVLRGVEDGKAFALGMNNMTSAHDLGALLTAIETGRAATAHTRDMIGILEGQEFHEEIPAGLPPGTLVAHKTGFITGVLHDAAIVYPAGRAPFVLVVLTRGNSDPQVLRAVIQDIARMSWETVMAADNKHP
jgi:beta-lactamase class A